MNVLNVEQIAREEFKRHGLEGWTFELGNSTTALGTCYNGRKLIRISRKFAAVNDEARMRNTILHEIAHALTPGHGHDEVWRAKAIELGCDGERCAVGAVSIQKKYVGVCPSCGTEVQVSRMTPRLQSGAACRSCVVNNRRRYDFNRSLYLFKWSLNPKVGGARLKPGQTAPQPPQVKPAEGHTLAVLRPSSPLVNKKVVKGVEVAWMIIQGRYFGSYQLNGKTITVDAKTFESMVSSVSHKIAKVNG